MMAESLPKISDAEWTVMRVFWENGECPVGEVIEKLSDTTDWKPRTIQTLVRRLHGKGALSRRDADEKAGRGYLYAAAVSEGDCEHAASRSFLGNVFGGELAPFLANLVEKESFSEAELEELRKILESGKEKRSNTKPENKNQ